MAFNTYGAAGILLLAGTCQAATFSFASDNNPNGPTFAGLTPSQFRDGGPLDLGGSVSVTFLADMDDNGPGGPVALPAIFTFTATLGGYTRTTVGNNFRHDYLISGTFSFRDDSQALIFSAQFNNALFSSFSSNRLAWGQTATIQDSDLVDPNMTFTTGAALGNVALPLSEDFAFTLTNLGTIASGGAVPVSETGAVEATWRSEGSWSAHAAPIPAPASFMLLGLGGLAAGRRRR